jgi:hypothetical protein
MSDRNKNIEGVRKQMELARKTRDMREPDKIKVSLDVWTQWTNALHLAAKEPPQPRRVWVRYETGTLESVCVRNFEPGEEEINADSTRSWHEFQVDGGAPLNEQEEEAHALTHKPEDYQCEACGEMYCHPGHIHCKGDPKARMIREYFKTRGKNDPKPPATNPGAMQEHGDSDDVRFMMGLVVRAASKVDAESVNEFLRGHASVDALFVGLAVKYLSPMAVALRQLLDHCQPVVERTAPSVAEYHREVKRSVDKEDIRAIITLNLHKLLDEMAQEE